jgi:hypothetical protein
MLLASATVNAGTLPVKTQYTPSVIGIKVNNNTVAYSNKISYDLNSYFQSPDDFSFNFGEFGYNPIGNLNDFNFEFEQGYLGSPIVSGDNFDATISFDTLSVDSIFYGVDISSLPRITLADAVTMYNAGGQTIGKGDLELPDISQFYVKQGQVSAVHVPAAAWLFAPALLGLVGLRRKQRQLG